MSRFAVIAAATVGPPVLLGALMVLVLAGAAVGWHPFWTEPPLTISEAAALKDRATLQRLISSGVDVNAPVKVRAPILKGYDITVTPLEASVGTRTPTAMQFLLARGARMDARERAVVTCLAIKDDAQEIVRFLREGGAQQPPDCEHVATPW
jgi:hypothetical protein